MKVRAVLVSSLLFVLGTGLTVWWQLPPVVDSGDFPAAFPADSEAERSASGTDNSTPGVLADVTAGSGVSFIHWTGEEADEYTILESLGGGVALLDYDGDGLLDLFIAGGGRIAELPEATVEGLPGRLYRNLGDMHFADVTVEAGLAETKLYAHGALGQDLDGDGWPDLLLTGYQGMELYRNQHGKFQRATGDAGLTDPRWATSAAAADLMGQGRADLFVCRYVDWSFAKHPICPLRGERLGRDVCAPQNFDALPSSLYENTAGGFVDRWEDVRPAEPGKALGVVIADLNDDGRPDLYVANDASPNWMFLNEGDGGFRECAFALGTAVDDSGSYNGSMGVDVGDFDGSGRASIWVTNFESELPALYRNMGTGGFAWHSQAAGLGRLGGRNVGFGTSFLDFDNDSWLDLVFVNGHVVRFPVEASFEQPPVLLRSEFTDSERQFVDVSARAGGWFQQPARGRGLATGDLNNDGWPDLVVSHSNTPVSVLQNTAGGQGQRHWLGLQLRGRGDRPVAGATVRVQLDADGRELTRFVRSGGSYLSTMDPRQLFGIGESERVSGVSVRWPWGELQQWGPLEADRYWLLEEGIAEATPAAGLAIR